MANEWQLQPGDTVDLDVRGLLVKNMRVLLAQRRGKCDRSGRWFDPTKDGETYIAYKGSNNLTPEERQHFFPNGNVWPLTVVLDRTQPEGDDLLPDDFDEAAGIDRPASPADYDASSLSVLAQAGAANRNLPPSVTAVKDETPSEYQNKILEQYLTTLRHIFIKALAGTGKTYTLVWLVKTLIKQGKLPRRVLFMAFNTKIAEELRAKLQGTGVPALTTHAALLKLLMSRFRELQAAGDKAVDMNKASKTFLLVLCDRLGLAYGNESYKKAKKNDLYKLKSAVSGKNGLAGKIKNSGIIPKKHPEGGFFGMMPPRWPRSRA